MNERYEIRDEGCDMRLEIRDGRCKTRDRGVEMGN